MSNLAGLSRCIGHGLKCRLDESNGQAACCFMRCVDHPGADRKRHRDGLQNVAVARFASERDVTINCLQQQGDQLPDTYCISGFWMKRELDMETIAGPCTCQVRKFLHRPLRQYKASLTITISAARSCAPLIQTDSLCSRSNGTSAVASPANMRSRCWLIRGIKTCRDRTAPNNTSAIVRASTGRPGAKQAAPIRASAPTTA